MTSARGRARATLHRHLVNISTCLARPQRKPVLHLPPLGPSGSPCGTTPSAEDPSF